jgi:hypothetical protein
VSVAGEFAFVSMDTKTRATNGYLLNGTRLECGELRIAIEQPNTPLEVRSVDGRTFHLAEALPTGVGQPGAYLLAPGALPLAEDSPRPWTGFEIESSTQTSITVRDYPVVPCDEIRVLSSRWSGPPAGN